MLIAFAGCLLAANSLCEGAFNYPTLDEYERFREVLFNGLRSNGHPNRLNTSRFQKPLNDSVPFPCADMITHSASVPDSVHCLRPGDVDVVAALGDSLTAGNGAAASDALRVLVENRGLSWAAGGEGTWRQYLTLPNILKEFNHNLVGYSESDAVGHQRAAQLNVAEGGAISADMPFQARLLVRRLHVDKRIDIQKHWKLVTLLIGGNDFCSHMCYQNASHTVGLHKTHLLQTLDYLQDNLPRTLINLVLVPDVGILREFTALPLYCHVLRSASCPCIVGLKYEDRQKEFSKIAGKWQQVENDIANDDRYNKKPDFAVVVQPFTQEIVFPLRNSVTDPTYLAPDCFHFSQKGHARAANAVWNNLMQPVGSKSRNWKPLYSEFLCPTKEQPYIYTGGNSDKHKRYFCPAEPPVYF